MKMTSKQRARTLGAGCVLCGALEGEENVRQEDSVCLGFMKDQGLSQGFETLTPARLTAPQRVHPTTSNISNTYQTARLRPLDD